MHRNREKRFDQSWKAAKQGVILSRRRRQHARVRFPPADAGRRDLIPAICLHHERFFVRW